MSDAEEVRTASAKGKRLRIVTDLHNGSISFYLDQKANKLKVRVKYSTGVLKTATIALT